MVERGYERLDKLGREKGLLPAEQATARLMAEAIGLRSADALLTSVDTFDRAAARWMARAKRRPWRWMQTQVDRLKAIRQKAGFRYLPAGRPPTTTRELELNQDFYTLAKADSAYHLLRARIVELDDLAIRTEPFARDGQPVKLPKRRVMPIFFWPEDGREYRFKTRVLKRVKRPAPYLLLDHGDSVTCDEGREFFSCSLVLEVTVEWLSNPRGDYEIPAPSLFDEDGSAQTISAQLQELSGTGFVLGTDAAIEINDLVRLEDVGLEFLGAAVGRAVDKTPSSVGVRFLDLPAQIRDTVLRYVVERISAGSPRSKENTPGAGSAVVPT
jgi:hypothetical protein